LAVFAGAVTTVASARAPVAATAAQEMTGVPCSHCDDCDRAPCPLPMADCLQAQASATPMLAIASVELPRPVDAAAYWSAVDLSLIGLSPPPDPFPPRA
jgi:hypothetical protein